MENEPQTIEGEASVIGRASISATVSVERGLNDMRLAVLGIIVTIGLTVGFGVDGPWWAKLSAGAGSLAQKHAES